MKVFGDEVGAGEALGRKVMCFLYPNFLSTWDLSV
jgi:hypothetical protein